jgi:hypothetical protein
MQHATELLTRWPRRLTAVILGAACALTVPVIAMAEPAIGTPSGTTSSAPASRAGAGQWINVDPKTGARIAPSVPTAATAPNPAFSTSHQGLVQEPAPGGGIMVDLQGRFRSAATATVGSNGKATVDCVPPGTAAHEQ